MRLVSNLDQLCARGFDARTALLSPRLRRDALGMTTPLLVEDDEQPPTWLVRHQERGAIEVSTLAEANVVYHDPYMTLNAERDRVEPSLSAAVEKLAGGQAVEVDPDLILARFDAIAERVTLRIRESEPSIRAVAEGTHTLDTQTLDTQTVEQRFRELLNQIRPAAQKLVAASEDLAPLGPLMDEWTSDTRFADLEELLAQRGADALLATSPINTEELLGKPSATYAGAIYARNSGEVRLFSADPLPALRASRARRILVEENDLPIGIAAALRSEGFTLDYGSDAIAKWRERRDYQYLPALIIVTAASRYALDEAITWARDQISTRAAITERDVQHKYLQYARRFAKSIGVEGVINEFFSNCHAGTRTLHPCLAAPYDLDLGTTSLKLDAGLAVVVDGVTLATSDVARTYLGSDEATGVYEAFQKIVRETIADQLRPGVVFADLHGHVLERIRSERSLLSSAGLWPSGIDLDTRYAMRNVGHLMGRQESFSSEFRVGEAEQLRIGDYGACEIQWPFGNHAIGAEEMWILTPTGPILLTK
ncbi:hypothetical protein BFN03_03330 [Rhodococcus sp. WMMA185]|uniref:M24 family metallopeptidase n=1 Tax=Rhodococcus sp. WMMA185 TaxID=679318 RepID=UPI000878BD23|nr:M24 family metallopeptidase [Rhodococcus sp. WMMA185]AOW92061.1 hypothetical protein BFN03_03330 [Rhodococcus sp. WMMA185]